MSRVATGVILGFVFIVALLVTAPARLLDGFIPADTLLLQGYSGTLWRGGASRALLATGSGYLHLGKVSWSLNPISLLTLTPSLHLKSSWGKQKINTELRLHSSKKIELSKLDALFSTQLLRQFLPLAVKGDISAQFDHLLLDNGLPISAQGRIVWQGGGWESNRGTVPLGSYVIDMHEGSEGGIRGDILTLSGNVTASGSIDLKGQEYSVDVLVSTGSAGNEQLQQALSLIAQAVPQGHRLKFDA